MRQTVTLTNTGRYLARGVVTSDILSNDQLSSVSNITGSSGSTTFNTTHETLSWNSGNLTVGQSATLTYTANIYFSRYKRVKHRYCFQH
ncbi:hypothetical protein ACLHDF_23985 [Priestia aryabhattai]|uniref:hypothetical protein n=1 Tax=Priestia megaterium TaxID=1404 RepID=UPI0039B86878